MPDSTQIEANSRYSFLARYGETILRGGIATIPAALFRYQAELGLGPQTVWFISAILSHKWDADMPHPSMKRMAEETGVSRQQLHTYQRQLVEGGWLRVINRRTESGGKDTSFYDFTPLFAKLADLLERDKSGSRQQDDNGSGHAHVNHSLHTHVNRTGHAYVNAAGHLIEPIPEADIEPSNFERSHDQEEIDGADSRSQPRGAPRGQETVPDALESVQRPIAPAPEASRLSGPQNASDEALSSDSIMPRFVQARAEIRSTLAAQRSVDGDGGRRSRRTAPSARPPGTPEERETLAAYLGDFARQFGDAAPLSSTITRVLTLFQTAQLPPEQWGDVLYQARSITQERTAQIRTLAADGEQSLRRKNKMPYFLAVLADLLGLEPESPM